MIDVHCHLEDDSFDGKREDIIKTARSLGVKAIITSGVGIEGAKKALEISDNVFVFPSIGVMPYELFEYEKVIEIIRRERSRIVSVGEVGLDYYWGKRETRENQRSVLGQFIELAKELGLPLVVHSRSAGRYALEVLIEEGAELVDMHAFDGSATHAAMGAEKGYYFSIPPSVVRSGQKQKLVRRISLDRLLLESDAPVLGPVREEINEPKNVLISAQEIARLKNVSFEQVIETTTNNAKELFGLKI